MLLFWSDTVRRNLILVTFRVYGVDAWNVQLLPPRSPACLHAKFLPSETADFDRFCVRTKHIP